MKEMPYINDQKRPKITFYPFYLGIVIVLFEILYVNLISVHSTRHLINHNSKIHLTIQGSGNKTLLSENFNYYPSKVLVNGTENELCNKTCYMTGSLLTKHNITLIFENTELEVIKSFENMFANIKKTL